MGDGAITQIGQTAARLTRRAVLLTAAALPLAGCGWNDSSWHQRITVIVDTPTGEVSGSAVTSIEWSENKIFKDGARWQLDYAGEAVVVDLGAGKYLFATLASGRRDKGSPEDIGRMGPRSSGLDESKGNEFKRHVGAITVSREWYPLLVTFADVNDPKSVVEVKPDDLATHFDSGYALKSISLEVTDEPVTTGVVESVLPWIGDPSVMENPGWAQLPEAARRLLGGFVSDYRAVQKRFVERYKP